MGKKVGHLYTELLMSELWIAMSALSRGLSCTLVVLWYHQSTLSCTVLGCQEPNVLSCPHFNFRMHPFKQIDVFIGDLQPNSLGFLQQ